MKTILMLSGVIQEIGCAGEKAIHVAINVSDWLTDYPDGTISLWCTKVDGTKAKLSPSIVNGMLIAPLTPECMSRPGYITIKAMVTADGVEAAVKQYRAYIMSVPEKGPAEYRRRPDWAKEVMVDAAQIRSSLDAALQVHAGLDEAVTTAQSARAGAEDAQTAAEEAADRAEAVQTEYESVVTDVDHLNDLIFNRKTVAWGKQITDEDGLTAGTYSLKLEVKTAHTGQRTIYVHAYSWVKDEVSE